MRRLATFLLAALALAALSAGVVVNETSLRTEEVSALAAVENPGPRGLEAARELLLASGTTATARHPFDPEARAAVVVLAAPQALVPEGEVRALLSRAEDGATLVVALGDTTQTALEGALGLSHTPGDAPRTAHALAPHRLFDGLSLPARSASLRTARLGALAVSGGEGWASAISVPAGHGEVLVFAGPEPFENAHLLEGDAVSLLVRLGRLGPVVFDERFLFPVATGGPPSRRALLLFALQLLLAGGALLLARGRRLGAIRPPFAQGALRTSRDYLFSLAALYRRAGAEEELAKKTWSELRRRLERRTGIPARLTDAEAARRAHPKDPGAALALALGGAALAAGGPGVLLRVTRAAADAEAALRKRRR